MTRTLITGCEGFLGSHLADFLVAMDLPVYGMVYGDGAKIEHLAGRIITLKGDLKERGQVERIVGEVRPSFVFHLAAQSFVTVSWEKPEETIETNVLGTLNLLETLRQTKCDATVLVVGSSAVLGPWEEEHMPLTEESEFRPTSIYAVSKIAEEMLGYFYWRANGMRVLRVRPFSMTGPRKSGDACSDFAEGIVEIERGTRQVLEVGNLNTVRDFTDGRDAARALWCLSQVGVSGQVYNLCSGRRFRIGDVLDKLIALSVCHIPFRVVPSKLRRYDDPIYVGDNSRLRALGWEPQIPLEKTLADTLSYWREKLGKMEDAR